MPIRVWVEKDRNLVRIEIMGNSTTEDIISSIDSVVNDTGAEPGCRILSDHTRVGEPLTTPQARRMAAHMEKLREIMSGCRWAVVSKKPASIGMMRMLSVLVESIPMTVEVFPSIEEAESWLFADEEGEAPVIGRMED